MPKKPHQFLRRQRLFICAGGGGGRGVPLMLQLLEDWVGISSLGRKGSIEGNEDVR